MTKHNLTLYKFNIFKQIDNFISTTADNFSLHMFNIFKQI